MKRRDFLKSSVTMAGMAGLGTAVTAASAAEANAPAAREYYELRLYHLRRGPKQKMFDDYLRQAAIPAFNRAGVSNVGVFSVMTGPDNPTVYVLLPYKNLEQFATIGERFRTDDEYQKAGNEFNSLPATDPLYVRVESSLMLAFEGMPKLEVPENKSRIFELRTYESHNKRANRKKIEMFNTGEIALFRRSGLQPVFFGETLIGSKLPNLTYMLTYENMAAHDKNWGVFGSSPEWKKMSTAPGFTDPEIVSNISNLFLRPASFSQI